MRRWGNAPYPEMLRYLFSEMFGLSLTAPSLLQKTKRTVKRDEHTKGQRAGQYVAGGASAGDSQPHCAERGCAAGGVCHLLCHHQAAGQRHAAMGLDAGFQYVYLSPSELLTSYFKLALVLAVVVVSPLLIFQIWGFVAPALTKRKSGRYGLRCWADFSSSASARCSATWSPCRL